MSSANLDELKTLWLRLAAIEEQISARERDYLDLQRQLN